MPRVSASQGRWGPFQQGQSRTGTGSEENDKGVETWKPIDEALPGLLSRSTPLGTGLWAGQTLGSVCGGSQGGRKPMVCV